MRKSRWVVIAVFAAAGIGLWLNRAWSVMTDESLIAKAANDLSVNSSYNEPTLENLKSVTAKYGAGFESLRQIKGGYEGVLVRGQTRRWYIFYTRLEHNKEMNAVSRLDRWEGAR